MVQTVLEVSIFGSGVVLRITQTFLYLQGSLIPCRGMGQCSVHCCKRTTAVQHGSSCSGMGNVDTVTTIFGSVMLSQGYYERDGFYPENKPQKYRSIQFEKNKSLHPYFCSFKDHKNLYSAGTIDWHEPAGQRNHSNDLFRR